MPKEIVYSEVRPGHFQPTATRAQTRRTERDRVKRMNAFYEKVAVTGLAIFFTAAGIVIVLANLVAPG